MYRAQCNLHLWSYFSRLYTTNAIYAIDAHIITQRRAKWNFGFKSSLDAFEILIILRRALASACTCGSTKRGRRANCQRPSTSTMWWLMSRKRSTMKLSSQQNTDTSFPQISTKSWEESKSCYSTWWPTYTTPTSERCAQSLQDSGSSRTSSILPVIIWRQAKILFLLTNLTIFWAFLKNRLSPFYEIHDKIWSLRLFCLVSTLILTPFSRTLSSSTSAIGEYSQVLSLNS